MLEVGDNEPDGVTKTGADGDVPAPRKVARRISREIQRAWMAVDRGPQRYGLKGRRNDGGQVGATAGKTSGQLQGSRATLAMVRRGDATAARGSV